MGYNFKDKYYDNSGNDIEFVFPSNVRFLTASRLSGGGNTRANPAASAITLSMSNTPLHYILDGGNHYRINISFITGANPAEDILSGFVGTNRETTKIKISGSVYNNAASGGRKIPNIYFKDLTFSGGSLTVIASATDTGSQVTKIRFVNCTIEDNPVLTGTLSVSEAKNCIFKTNVSFIKTSSRISFLNAVTQGTFASLSAYEGCDITITQATLSSYYSNYISFDKCRFKFPNDTEYTALNGNTPEELRNDFISRCDANGLTYNRITEYDYDNVPLGRWLFTTGNSGDAIIYKDTDIDSFETTRGIRFGFSSTRPSRIKITNDNSLPGSINPGNPNSGNIVFNENSISFPSGMDITEDNDFHVTSNIMPLDGIRKIDGIFTPNSLPWEYGFIVDAEKMGFAGKIEGAFGFDKTDMRHPKKLQNAKLVFCDELIQLLERATIIQNKQPIYENPSPGNKAGGISTLEEKSLGCTQKSGTSKVKDVLMYGDRLKIKGLNLLSAPGNDLVASTALASSGCHIVLFTTGRGTPFGTFVPTMKISTNSNLYNHKQNWIDFNAGTLLEGESMDDLSRRFAKYIIGVASGEQVNNEKKNYREIAIFKTGVISR